MVEELAEFLDRNGYGFVRANENIDEIADDIVIEANAPGVVDPVKVGLFDATLGLLLMPLMLLWRFIWRDIPD